MITPRFLSVVGGALLLALPAAGMAEISFQPFSGANASRVGDGGTVVVHNATDFWVMGSPARPYQVIGTLIDIRSANKAAGDAIDTKAVSSKIAALGGNAAIVTSIETRAATRANRQLQTMGQTAHGTGWSAPADERVTTMLVIKYTAQ